MPWERDGREKKAGELQRWQKKCVKDRKAVGASGGEVKAAVPRAGAGKVKSVRGGALKQRKIKKRRESRLREKYALAEQCPEKRT